MAVSSAPGRQSPQFAVPRSQSPQQRVWKKWFDGDGKTAGAKAVLPAVAFGKLASSGGAGKMLRLPSDQVLARKKRAARHVTACKPASSVWDLLLSPPEHAQTLHHCSSPPLTPVPTSEVPVAGGEREDTSPAVTLHLPTINNRGCHSTGGRSPGWRSVERSSPARGNGAGRSNPGRRTSPKTGRTSPGGRDNPLVRRKSPTRKQTQRCMAEQRMETAAQLLAFHITPRELEYITRIQNAFRGRLARRAISNKRTHRRQATQRWGMVKGNLSALILEHNASGSSGGDKSLLGTLSHKERRRGSLEGKKEGGCALIYSGNYKVGGKLAYVAVHKKGEEELRLSIKFYLAGKQMELCMGPADWAEKKYGALSTLSEERAAKLCERL